MHYQIISSKPLASVHSSISISCPPNKIMFLSAGFFVLAFCVSDVSTRNETLQHGWVREPTGRGTCSILWSCLSTIFICTWVVLHPDVPKPDQKSWYHRALKIASMLGTMIAPEYLVAHSAQNYWDAQELIKLLRESGYQGWTLTHAQFAIANGFHMLTQDGNTQLLGYVEFRRSIAGRRIDGPLMSEDELKSRGRSDGLIKLVAILHIIWFAIQTLVRAIEHYQIAAIEMLTVGFVLCSTFTYGFYWHQPQDVDFPVDFATQRCRYG